MANLLSSLRSRRTSTMSESGQPSDRLPKDPVRIVYHAENRTFARLFNEHSLDQVKDVVRRKLGLGRETDVSLKQMRPDALLDLEDDDDFQAFCALLKSCASVDIQVTLGRSQGAPVPPPVASVSWPTSSLGDVLEQVASQQPQGQPSVTDPPITSSALPSEEPATSAAAGQPSARPGVANTSEPSTATKKAPGRKRKVSFGNAVVATPGRPAEQPTQSKPIAVTPVLSAKTPAAPKPAGAEEPPKKKQKKESVKAKGVQPTDGVESPSAEASSTPKKVRVSMPLARGGKPKTFPRDGEPSEPPAKKPKKHKKDDSAVSKMAFAPSPDGTDQPVSHPSHPVNDTSLQPAPEGPTRSGAEGGGSKTRQSEKKIGACAAIPRTSESACVQSEVATAILSGYLSRASETISPAPPAKRKSVKKGTKNSSASSSALPAKSTTVSHAPANGLPNVVTGHRLEHVVPVNEPPQHTRELNGPPCPICLGEPFHIRFRCPIVLKGPGAIRERLEEVKGTNVGDQQSLIKELEGLLRDSEVTSEPLLNAAQLHDAQMREASQPLNVSVPQTPNIPSNSHLSEVTVESRDEGSSSESSDDMSMGRIEHGKELPAPGKQKTPDNQPSSSNDDLEAVIRGPALKRQSILHVLDRIAGDEDDNDSDSEEEEDEDVLEEDLDEEISRPSIRLSKHVTSSSDSKSDEEESRTSSPSSSVKDNLEPTVQGSNNPVEGSTEHRGDDAVVGDHVDPPALGGQDDDSSEDTHVGSEDRMVVDDPIVEKQPSSPAPRASVLHSSDVLGNEPPESGKTDVDPASNRDGGGPVASKVRNEAEADPIEPADDLEPPTMSRSLNTDPVEAPPEEIGTSFSGVTQSTLKPGVTKRIKTRNGQILDDEAERPVLLERLASGAMEDVTPLPTKGKSRKKITEISASQEPATTRKSLRFSSLPPSTSTPAAMALQNRRTKVGVRSGKAAKMPAKWSGQQTDVPQRSAKDDDAQNGVRIASTPLLNRWETLAEPSSSPSLQPDGPPVYIDELMSSSPQPDDPIRGRLTIKEKESELHTPGLASKAGKERLFDLSSSQIPFPYSQHKNNPVSTAFPNGKEGEMTTDSEDESKGTKKKTKLPVRYRPLSQLASQATLFSPSLPTPASKSLTDGKTKKRVTNGDSSSSSSSSDEEEVGGSEHIPRGRRAGSVLETKKKKKKSLLSRI